MSLRRKIALWLCPELGCKGGIDYKAKAFVDGWPTLTLAMDENAEAARRAAEEAALRHALIEEIRALTQEVAQMRRDWVAINS